uniref:Uncharacterized protein n=1 Tax=Oryza glumipatula TaxID=40148 RepID=A0A0D9ZTF2_9ORYZ
MGIRGGGGDRPAHGGEDAGPRVEEAGSCFFSVDGWATRPPPNEPTGRKLDARQPSDPVHSIGSDGQCSRCRLALNAAGEQLAATAAAAAAMGLFPQALAPPP